jgi:muramoyltetrapeptide carboxypeptidase
LQEGDRVRIVLSSGPCPPEQLDKGLEYWRQWGYVPVPTLPSGTACLPYLAANDTERLQVLQLALDDPTCSVIACGRGGYGVTRLLSLLNWNEFCRFPKWIVGFSDITALLWAAARQGIASLHAPLVSTLPDESPQSRDRLFHWLRNGQLDNLVGQPWQGGTAKGLLFPANLTVATALIGTPSWPLGSTPVILALEDVNEDPYRLDRMLTQWRNSGALSSVVGVALGRFSWTDPLSADETYTATAVLRDRLLDLQLPLVADLPFGHGEGDNCALPLGVWAVLDGDRGSLSLET